MSQARRIRIRVGRPDGHTLTRSEETQKKAQSAKEDSPFLTPEALASIKLRRVEEEQPLQQTQESFEIKCTQKDDGPHLDAGNERSEEVRSDTLNSDLNCRPLREGLDSSKECPSQTESGKPPSDDTKVTLAGAINNVGDTIGQASPWDEPERKASTAAISATLRPPMLIQDGKLVTGALKHHLKKQNKRQKLRRS